jgi:amino acid adenylation domain-containing protein
MQTSSLIASPEAGPAVGAAAPGDVIADFLAVVRTHPDSAALVDNGRRRSYASLAQRARELAERLGQNCGVVGVTIARSEDTIIALLAVLLAGGTYCPIDPAFPLTRRRSILRVAGCRTVLVADPAQVDFPDQRVLAIQDPSAAPRGALEPLDDSHDAPAYILFTSGSTGDPRPVATPRAAIGAAVRSLREYLDLRPTDRVLQFASLNWDTCFEEILTALTAGATLVIHQDAYAGSFQRLLRMIERERVTALDLPTAFWHELVHHLGEGQVAMPPSVRTVIIGGEAAHPRRLVDWSALDTGAVRLINTYGCTETTLVTHAIDLWGPHSDRAAAWQASDEVPIGRALPHILERIGEAGELMIGGPGLALGYLGDPEATARRFPTLDFGAGPQRFFLTGDRVARDSAGALLHRGRLDAQLKVRGIRVDPREVEVEIATHKAVAAVAVVGVTVADHTKLVAYVVPRRGAEVATLEGDLVAYLRGRVPAHIVPSKLTIVPDLVHTPSGKVDRAASHLRHSSLGQARRPGT